MEKIDVNGENAHPIFVYLRQNTEELRSKTDPESIMNIPWNFCRWIVDRRGRVLKYLNPSV
jgi:glutathione peroxidase